MVQIMAAVVGVLNESLTESLKGFYKMRKAYMALDGILRMEERYLQTTRSKVTPITALQLESKALSSTPSSAHSSTQDLTKQTMQLSVGDKVHTPSSPGTPGTPLGETFSHGPNSAEFSHPIDAFIHSGASLCFGVLLLILSMIPPTFSRLLAIIGFRGDKERGLRMLWQASKFDSLVGAIAAFAILGYYNGFVRFCDIIPDATNEGELEVEGYPVERLTPLLQKMRKRYPNSQLWLLEESRMKGANRDLETALDMLKHCDKSPLKQVEGLQTFEKSLDAMYLHRYEECAESFISVSKISNIFIPSADLFYSVLNLILGLLLYIIILLEPPTWYYTVRNPLPVRRTLLSMLKRLEKICARRLH